MVYINILACSVIAVWAAWCAISCRIRCGWVCWILFVVTALAAVGVISGPHGEYTDGRKAEVTMNVALGMLSIRFFYMKYRLTLRKHIRRFVKWWAQ